jgi:hypothetical protein
MSTRSPLLEAALTHAEHGYSVFPTAPRGKRPLTANGFKAATRDERDILHRWQEYPDANVAVACGASRIVVLDIDSKAGADPQDVLGELDIAGVPLIYTGEAPEPSERDPNSLSGVRGAHLYFAGDLAGTNKLSIAGCEIRGSQHYVVAPPSVHPSGVVYDGTLPPVAELPPVPDWLLAMVAAPNGNASAPAVAEMIPAGARNATLASIAGTMRRRGMSAKAITAALQVENEERCRPPLSVGEVEQIATSIARYAAKAYNPTDAAATADPGGQSAAPAKGKLQLPPTPDLADVAGQCAWLTSVFQLDPAHPIVSGKRHGHSGPECHVELRRAGGAPAVSFEPATRINNPRGLVETLAWSVLPTDGATPAFKGEHCQQIAHAIRMLCGAAETLTAKQEAAGIVSTLLSGAVEVEHAVTTYGGTGGQKYEAAMSLRREIDPTSGRAIGPVRFARDADTGELVIAVADLMEAARRHTGSSLPHGWVDARMGALDGWERITLQGHGLPGEGRSKRPHARIYAYRGHLTTADDD